MEGSHALRRLPPDEDRFYLDLLPFEHRTVGRAGISLFNVTYSDGVLSTLLARPKQRFLVRYDPRDLSRVFLRDEAGAYWPIPYSDRRLPPATLAEINAATRRLRAAGEHRVTSGRIFKAIEEQRVLVAAALATTKAVHREAVAQRRTAAATTRPGRG
jgi:putative transposase